MNRLKIFFTVILGIILSLIGGIILGSIGIGKYLGVHGILVWPILLIIFIYFLVSRKSWKSFIGTFLLVLGIELILLFPANLLVGRKTWIAGFFLIYTLPLSVFGLILSIIGIILVLFKQRSSSY